MPSPNSIRCFPDETNAGRDSTRSQDSVRAPSTQSCTERQEDQRAGEPAMAVLFKKPASNGFDQASNQHRDIRQCSRKLTQISTYPPLIKARLVPLSAKGERCAPRRRDEMPFRKSLQCHQYVSYQPTQANFRTRRITARKQGNEATEDALAKQTHPPMLILIAKRLMSAEQHDPSLDRSVAYALKR